jgi:hypothetical protein
MNYSVIGHLQKNKGVITLLILDFGFKEKFPIQNLKNWLYTLELICGDESNNFIISSPTFAMASIQNIKFKIQN